MALSGSTFTTSRFVPHAPEAVYAAFERADVLAAWWGPAGFSNTFEVFEFVPGGRWLFTMHGPDGANYANRNVFVVLEPARRVVLRHDGEPFFTLTVEPWRPSWSRPTSRTWIGC
jgi:uncharacterized protein YndB with AHSA1/START domain